MTPNTNANQNLLADAIRTSINPDDIKVIIRTIVGKAKLGCLPSAKFVFDELLTPQPISERNLHNLKGHEREIALKPNMKATSDDVLAFEQRMRSGQQDVEGPREPLRPGDKFYNETDFLKACADSKLSRVLPEEQPVTAGHNSVEYPVSQICTEAAKEKMTKTKEARKVVSPSPSNSVPSGQTSDIERIVLWLKIVGDGKAPDIAKGAGLSLAETLAVIDHNPKWFECKNNRYSLKTRV